MRGFSILCISFTITTLTLVAATFAYDAIVGSKVELPKPAYVPPTRTQVPDERSREAARIIVDGLISDVASR